MKNTKYLRIAERLKGRWTVETLRKELGVSRNKAIYTIHRLRKLGYVKTWYGRNKVRVYYISLENQSHKKSYTDVINKYAPVGLAEWQTHYVYGREITAEEALIYALKKRDVRYTIASLALFRHIKDWSALYRMAKKEGLVHEIAALHEVARLFLKKLQRMPKRFYNLALKDKKSRKYIKDKSSSEDFKDIERKWKVDIPLNRVDLSEYRGIAR